MVPGHIMLFTVHHDTWGDFNNDGKLDYFGIYPGRLTQDNGPFGNEKSVQFIFISDYFTESNRTYKALMSEYINWACAYFNC